MSFFIRCHVEAGTIFSLPLLKCYYLYEVINIHSPKQIFACVSKCICFLCNNYISMAFMKRIKGLGKEKKKQNNQIKSNKCICTKYHEI